MLTVKCLHKKYQYQYDLQLLSATINKAV